METVIYRCAEYQLIRIVNPSGDSVLVKRFSSADNYQETSVVALVNEQRMLEKLKDISGCPTLINADIDKLELFFLDFAGMTLSQSALLGQTELTGFIRIAKELTRILAAFHNKHVILKNISPDNILIGSGDDPVLLITDFTKATSFAYEYSVFSQQGQFSGNLAFISPEQTGLMNRPVDYRSDLYSLGTIFYALVTGAPPFVRSEASTLIYSHLAETPIAPHLSRTWLPLPLSELILLLLSKEPDDRYQSAAGVFYDLQLLENNLTENTSLTDLSLRQRDLALLPHPPHRLYGRDHELAILKNAFERVRTGGSGAVFIGGYAGVGKTSLIQAIQGPVTLQKGLFITGKFEQFQRNQAFSAPAQCLSQLCQLISAEPESVVMEIRQQILQEIGSDVADLLEVIPEFKPLLGTHKTLTPLGPIENQIRTRTLLIRALRQIAKPSRPLVVFLDDLQWADQPSLDFIDTLVQDEALNGLLFIGAYRDNEMDLSHPLIRMMRRQETTGKQAVLLNLKNLNSQDLDQLLADMLNLKPALVKPLAKLLYTKTDGNPFFASAFLTVLYRQGAIYPDTELNTWCWDSEVIMNTPVSENLVDFLVEHLNDLAIHTLDNLVTIACLGIECTLDDLALATAVESGDLINHLTPALERGILMTSNAQAFYLGLSEARLRFSHDRMLQAVYQLRDENWLRLLHLAIARRFRQAPHEKGKFLNTAEHYAAAVELIESAEEKTIARALFLEAARHARQAGAFETAERYLSIAIELLPGDAWQNNQSETLDLYTELHISLYSQSQYKEADQVFSNLEKQMVSSLQMVEPVCIQITSLSNRMDYLGAVILGCSYAKRLGMSIPNADIAENLDHELDQFYQRINPTENPLFSERDAEYLDRVNAIAKLMNRMIPPAFFVQPLLAFWLAVRMGHQWMDEGYRALYIFPASCIAMATITLRGDYPLANRIGSQTLSIGLTKENGPETARAQHTFSLFVCHWLNPLAQTLEHAHNAFKNLKRFGDLEFACYSFFASQAALFDTCNHLSQMNEETHAAISFARKYGNQHSEQTFQVFQQMVRTLEGKTEIAGGFDDAEFAESAFLESAQSNTMALCFFHIYRGISALLFNDEAMLVEHAEVSMQLIPYISGFYPTALANILQALAIIVKISQGQADTKSAQQSLSDIQTWLKGRALDAPMNFEHLNDFIEAERLNADHQPWEAIKLFESAMLKAQANQSHWHLAIITEHAGLCSMQHGLEHAGRSLLIRAHQLYRQWGAEAKSQQMQSRLPFLDRRYSLGDRRGNTRLAMDHQTLLSAMTALGSEKSLSSLVTTTTTWLAKITGATDMHFLLQDVQGQWHLEGGMTEGTLLEHMTLERAQTEGILSVYGFRMGLNSHQPIVSEDAVVDIRFAGDPYFSQFKVCSFFVFPIFLHDRICACLLLGNHFFRAAFTTEMTETISMLSTQLALTIENLFIHQSLESKVAERTKQLAIANRAKSEFLANMTHEIRTPMNSIIGMTSLVLNSELKREQRDYLDKVQSASNKLLKLINNILDFSKMESGHLSLESTRFYLTDTLQNTINLFAILLEEKKLNLALDIGNDVPKWIIGDSLRLSQVMNNLLGNAIKFTERGEIQIKVDRIPLATKMASKQMLRFRVIDTGIGISNHYLEKLFSAFTQGDPSISRRFGGTGLGLSISKSLVELMGGEISVTSQEGQGSTFTFTAAFGISPDHETLSSIPEKGNINEKTLLIPKLVSGLAEEYHQAEFSTIDLESLRTLLIELEALLATNRLKAKKVSQKIELLLENSALFSEYIPVSLYIRKMLYREALSAFKTFQAYLNARYSDVSLNESI